MPLLNPDGTPYRTSGCLEQYGAQNSSQFDLFNQWDQESIQRGGTPIFYYEVFVPDGVIDTDYWEARGKIFSHIPVQLWASYEPMPSQNNMNPFGMDSNVDVVFEVNAKAAIKAIGRMPKLGSRIYTPHLGNNWLLIQRNLGEFKMWGALRIQLIAKQFQETVTTSGGRVTENSPNIPKAI